MRIVTRKPKPDTIRPGDLVAFNLQTDATRYMVCAIAGHILTVRQTDATGRVYASMDADTSMVVRHWQKGN